MIELDLRDRTIPPTGGLGAVAGTRLAPYETVLSTRGEHYRAIPRGAAVPWGQGPLLTAIRAWSSTVARF